jgi:sigma-E factor negative regulatory protein RseA
MSNKSDEILSAFIDEETIAFESRLCIKELLSNDGQRSRWERYHVIRDVLHGNLPEVIGRDFSHAVMQQIQDQEVSAPDKATGFTRYRFLKPIGGLAIAASVAALTIFAIRPYLSSDSAKTVLEVAKIEPNVKQEAAVSSNIPPVKGWISNPSTEARMNSYLVNHAEYAARQGVMPYARIVGYDMNR